MEDQKQNQKDKNKKKQLYYGIALIILIIAIAGVAIWYFTTNNKNADNTELAYTELIKKINDGEVEKVEMTVGSSSAKIKLRGEEEEKNGTVTLKNMTTGEQEEVSIEKMLEILKDE